MIKNYVILFLMLVIFAVAPKAYSQSKLPATQKVELNFYPNPTSEGKIYLTSSNPTSNKEVEIFDVLGKLVLKATVIREVNVSSLHPGVYLIKIKEGENTATKKMIVK